MLYFDILKRLDITLALKDVNIFLKIHEYNKLIQDS